MKIMLLVLLALASPTLASVALGNLAVIIKPEGLISTVDNPLRAQTQDLWCQASSNNEVQPIEWARFIRHQDRKLYDATIDRKEKQARLVFGEASVTDSGKYRCEIRTESGDLIYGNMFAYSRPVIHTNSSFPVKMSDHDPQLVEAPETSTSLGETVTLTCPVVGFPIPSIVWFKDNLPLESEDRVTIKKDFVTIEDVEESDGGVYRCVASNQFSVVVDGAEQQFEVKMEQKLIISGETKPDIQLDPQTDEIEFQSLPYETKQDIQIISQTDAVENEPDVFPISYYGWVIPLIVILIIIILLFIIIYTCQAVKRYKADNYNVARHEQNIRRSEEHSLTKNEV